MNNRLLEIISGNTGGRLVAAGGAVTGEWSALIVNEDAVISALLVDGVDVVAARGLTGATLRAGMLLSPGLAQSATTGWAKFTSITLTSGTVLMY